MGMQVGCLMGVAGVVQFLGRRGGRELRPEKIVGKKGGGPSQVDQNRIHRVKAFRSPGLFGEVKRRQWLVRWIAPRRWQCRL